MCVWAILDQVYSELYTKRNYTRNRVDAIEIHASSDLHRPTRPNPQKHLPFVPSQGDEDSC